MQAFDEVDEAIVWGRERAPLVLVRLGPTEGSVYSAGERRATRQLPELGGTDLAPYPDWPPSDWPNTSVPPLPRAKVSGHISARVGDEKGDGEDSPEEAPEATSPSGTPVPSVRSTPKTGLARPSFWRPTSRRRSSTTKFTASSKTEGGSHSAAATRAVRKANTRGLRRRTGSAALGCDDLGVRPVEFVFEFVARYEVKQLERIDRQFASRVLAFPDAVPVDRQQELAEAPIIAVAPAHGEAWIGLFHGGGYGVPPAAPAQVIGWPDERSFCVVKEGAGCLVETDNPTKTSEIDVFPITDVLAVPHHNLVVFADFTDLTAYGPAGIAWRAGRIALDELEILRVEGDVLHVAGFFGTVNRAEFSVDLHTGRPMGAPYLFDEEGRPRE